MFSFHKPRVYRSSEGCCICRAKSSSSRFTDSKKYEEDSIKCFNLDQPRQGEICNACVLLVKRFKRLPVGSNRHWGHVVDARIGPGMKSMSRFKKLREECLQQRENPAEYKVIGNKISSVSEKFCKIFRKNKKKRLDEKRLKVKTDDNSSDENFSPATPESQNSDEDEMFPTKRRRISGIRRRKFRKPIKMVMKKVEVVDFFDETDWSPRWSCCGLVYENSKIGALLVDFEKCKPCSEHVNFFISNFPTPTKVESSKIVSEKNKVSPLPYLHNENNAIGLKCIGNMPVESPGIAIIGIPGVSRGLSAPKKHHLYSKRYSDKIVRNEFGSPSATTKFHNADVKQINCINHSITHNIKSDAEEVEALHTEKNISGMSNDIKSPIVMSSNLSLTNALPLRVDKSVSTKFSDNSSDSGFDENLPDPSINSAVLFQSQNGKNLKPLLKPMDTLFLSSTIAESTNQKLLFPSHKNIQTPHNIAVFNSHKIRAVYNSETELSCGALPSSSISLIPPNSLMNASLPIAGSSISSSSESAMHNHKTFLYVKGNQNIGDTFITHNQITDK